MAALLSPRAASTAAAAGWAWFDGMIKESVITNCASMIFGNPYLENGAAAYVGFYANPDSGQPAPGDTYYIHVVVYGLGNSCAGQYAVPEIALPPNTSLAITGGTPIFCYAISDGTGTRNTTDCPTALQASTMHPGAYSILPRVGDPYWPLPQGKGWEFQIPVTSSTALTAATLQGYAWMLDGDSSPWLAPTQGIYVFNASTPTVVYPTPSTTEITRTSAKSRANVYTGGQPGTVHFQLGTTTAYEVVHETDTLTSAYVNWEVWDNWTPPGGLQPDTLYHFRIWFHATASGMNYYGADQTFRTAGGAESFVVSGAVGGQPGGTKHTVTVKAIAADGLASSTYRGAIRFSSDDASASLPADYTFTAADNGMHTFPDGAMFMTAGTHEIRVRDKADSSLTGAQSGIFVTSSIAPPTATIAALPPWKAATGIALKWDGAAGTFPVGSYDVQYRRAPWNGAYGPAVAWKSATAAKSATFTGAAGSTYCFSARARDTLGGVSPWTAETCTAVPLDDRSLSRTGAWTLGTGASYYASTYSQATATGSRLTRTGVQAKRIAITATTCPTCGSVGVYWGSKLLKQLSLASATTVYRKLIPVTTFTDVKNGTLSIRVTSGGKPVVVDGVAISRE